MKPIVKILIALVILAVGLFVAFKIAYNKQDDKVKAGLNAIGLTVEPWNKRADIAIKATIDATVAESIMNITHPSGKKPALAGVTTSDLGGDRMSAKIAVNWKGGILGTDYTTTVEWTFNKIAHESTTLAADNATIKVAKENMEQLNKYFLEKVFPVVKHNIN